MVPVPKTTPEGYNVLIYRLSDADTSKLQFVDAMKGFFLFNDIRLSEDGLSPGYIVIFDMKDVCLSHLAKISLSAVRKFMHYIQVSEFFLSTSGCLKKRKFFFRVQKLFAVVNLQLIHFRFTNQKKIALK